MMYAERDGSEEVQLVLRLPMCSIKLHHPLPNPFKYFLSRVSHALSHVQHELMADL
jgi:hypothetical protein